MAPDSTADAEVARLAEHEAAVARAQEVEKECTASAERDAAATRACDALDRTRRERKAAAAALDDDNGGDSSVSASEDALGDLHDALLLHEAAALLNLHA